MSAWKAKRFWKEVSVQALDAGFGIQLDARPVRTPAKALMVVPTRAMAEAIADEWRAVEKEIDPRRMPVTRAANAAIDKVAPQFVEVADLIAAYGASDLLCYRAVGRAEMVAAQATAWDPMLDWAARRFDAPLKVTSGVAPIDQPTDSVRRLSAQVHACDNFQLTALYDLVSLSGSLVLGLAMTSGDFQPETLWTLSRFDEDWQAREWGEDEEASVIAERKREDFLRACHFWKLSTPERE